jgi:hypothetical protein
MNPMELIREADRAIAGWGDLSPRERMMADLILRLSESLGRTYTVAWNACPREYAEPEKVSRPAGTTESAGGVGSTDWTLLVNPDLRTYDFNGKVYHVGVCTDPVEIAGGWGFCQDRKDDAPILWVHEEPRGPQLIQITVHEAMHACLDDRFSEAEVDRVAKDVSAFVLRMLMWRHPEMRQSYGIADFPPPASGEGTG